jgi:hypothetical protein
VNKNRLKNSFLKKFNSRFIWREISKMINLKFLCFSDIFLCRGNKDFSILSEYIFDIYLEDFFAFINDIYIKYNFRLFLVFRTLPYFPIGFSPIEFGKNKKFFNLKKKFLHSYGSFCSSYFIKHNKKLNSFKRCTTVINYKYHSIVFFSSSKKFSVFIKQKLFSFIRSNLHFDVLECATCLSR